MTAAKSISSWRNVWVINFRWSETFVAICCWNCELLTPMMAATIAIAKTAISAVATKTSVSNAIAAAAKTRVATFLNERKLSRHLLKCVWITLKLSKIETILLHNNNWQPNEYLICRSIVALRVALAISERDNQDNNTNKRLNENTIKIFYLPAPPEYPDRALPTRAISITTEQIIKACEKRTNRVLYEFIDSMWWSELLNGIVQISILLSYCYNTGIMFKYTKCTAPDCCRTNECFHRYEPSSFILNWKRRIPKMSGTVTQ